MKLTNVGPTLWDSNPDQVKNYNSLDSCNTKKHSSNFVNFTYKYIMAFFIITKITIPQTFSISRNTLVNFVNFTYKYIIAIFIITKIMPFSLALQLLLIKLT